MEADWLMAVECFLWCGFSRRVYAGVIRPVPIKVHDIGGTGMSPLSYQSLRKQKFFKKQVTADRVCWFKNQNQNQKKLLSEISVAAV